jgi:hypothetical protein
MTHHDGKWGEQRPFSFAPAQTPCLAFSLRHVQLNWSREKTFSSSIPQIKRFLIEAAAFADNVEIRFF